MTKSAVLRVAKDIAYSVMILDKEKKNVLLARKTTTQPTASRREASAPLNSLIVASKEVTHAVIIVDRDAKAAAVNAHQNVKEFACKNLHLIQQLRIFG